MEQVFKHIEEWWGERLSNELIVTIANAPRKHINAWLDAWPDLKSLEFTSLPLLQPGEIRTNLCLPDHGYKADPSQRAQLLLYSPRVVIGADLLERTPWKLKKIVPDGGLRFGPITGVETSTANSEMWFDRWWDQHETRQSIAEQLRWLLTLKSLIFDGSILFAEYPVRDPWPGLSDELHQRLWQGVPDWMDDDQYNIRKHFFRQLHLLSGRLITPVAWSYTELLAYRAALSNGGAWDRRVSRASTLARLPLPNLLAPTALLAKIRSNDEVFAEWRSALSEAIDSVELLSDTDGAAKSASAIVIDQLAGRASKLERTVRKSEVLASLFRGFRTFGIESVAAGIPALIQHDPVAAGLGAGSAAVGMAANSGLENFPKRNARRALQSFLIEWAEQSRNSA